MAIDPNERGDFPITDPTELDALAQRARDFVPPPTLPGSTPITPQLILFEMLESALRGEVDGVIISYRDDAGEMDVTWSNMSPGELALHRRRLGTVIDMIIDDEEYRAADEDEDGDDDDER